MALAILLRPDLSSIHDDEALKGFECFFGSRAYRNVKIVRVWPYVQAVQSLLIHPVPYISRSNKNPGSNSNLQRDRNYKLTMLGFLFEDCSSLMAELARRRRLWPRRAGRLRRRRVHRMTALACARSRAWTAPIPSKRRLRKPGKGSETTCEKVYIKNEIIVLSIPFPY